METGQTIAGKYRLNHLLGQGGMASVWSATNVFTDRQFAIKFMLPQVARTPESARRFLLEAKASARINHPNVIEVIDVGQAEDGAPFLVMELLTGMTLETAMRRQKPPMTVHDFSVVMLDVSRAMAAAHRSGVIHRDLKPTNVFLHKDRHGIAIPKILDFGVSKFLEEERTQNKALTLEGTVLGSPMYMSPEQARGLPIDSRTDVFSFGSILFEGLAGFRCYDAANFNALLVKVATQVPLDIDECAPDMPEALRQLVQSCLIVDPKSRLASFEEVSELLGFALPHLEGTTQRLPLHRETMEAEMAPSEAQLTEVRPGGYRLSEPVGPSGVNSPWTSSGSRRAGGGMSIPPSAGGTMRLLRSANTGRAVAVAGVGGLVAVVALSIYARGGSRSQGDALPPIVASIDAGGTMLSVDPANKGPVVTLDTLPVVPNRVPPSPGSFSGNSGSAGGTKGAGGTGYLVTTAAPGWCTLYVDGAAQGPTPVSLDLPSGPHQLRCETSTGKSKTATVVLTEGNTTKQKFAL